MLYQLRLVVSPNIYRGFLYLPRAENRTINDSGPGFSEKNQILQDLQMAEALA